MSNTPSPALDGMDLLSEDWLKQSGFRWHQLDRQPTKHWLLWLGACMADPGERFYSIEDFGIEVAQMVPVSDDRGWHCWLRADTAHLYSRLIHVRTVRTSSELIRIIEGLTGVDWNPSNNLYGAMHPAAGADRIRQDDTRLDRVLVRQETWNPIERDPTRGGALPDHVAACAEKKK